MKPAEVYILDQNEPFKSILLHLQLLIEQNFSNVKLEFKWKIPFYYIHNKPFCYLNPSIKKGYVDLGFYATEEFSVYNEFIISESRKKVKSLRYYQINDINSNILISVLNEVYLKIEN